MVKLICAMDINSPIYTNQRQECDSSSWKKKHQMARTTTAHTIQRLEGTILNKENQYLKRSEGEQLPKRTTFFQFISQHTGVIDGTTLINGLTKSTFQCLLHIEIFKYELWKERWMI